MSFLTRCFTPLSQFPNRAKSAGRHRFMSTDITAPSTIKYRRRLRNAALLLMGSVSVLGGLVYYGWFVDSATRFLLLLSHSQTGVKVTAQSVSGGLRAGRLCFKGMQFSRGKHALSNFDVSVATLKIRFSWDDIMRRLWNREVVRFEEVYVEGVKGSFEKTGNADEQSNFEFGELRLENVLLNADTPETETKKLLTKPRLFLKNLEFHELNLKTPDFFQLLTSTRGTGKAGPSEFAIRRRGTSTHYEANNVPIGFMQPSLVYPLSLINSAAFGVNMLVVKKLVDKEPILDCDVDVEVRDLAVDQPTQKEVGEEAVSRTVGGLLVSRYLEDNPGELNLHFQVTLGRKDLEPKRMIELVQQAVVKQLAIDAGRQGVEWAKQTGDALLQEFSERLIQKLRKAPD